MTAALTKQLSQVLVPPALDWASMIIDDDLKRSEKHVDKFDAEALLWRATAIPSLRDALEKIKARSCQQTTRERFGITCRTTCGGRKGYRNFATPLHSKPEFADAITRLSTLSRAAGKFVRKLMRRVEKNTGSSARGMHRFILRTSSI